MSTLPLLDIVADRVAADFTLRLICLLRPARVKGGGLGMSVVGCRLATVKVVGLIDRLVYIRRLVGCASFLLFFCVFCSGFLDEKKPDLSWIYFRRTGADYERYDERKV